VSNCESAVIDLGVSKSRVVTTVRSKDCFEASTFGKQNSRFAEPIDACYKLMRGKNSLTKSSMMPVRALPGHGVYLEIPICSTVFRGTRCDFDFGQSATKDGRPQ
jgi:hypothetical protein